MKVINFTENGSVLVACWKWLEAEKVSGKTFYVNTCILG